MSEIKYNAKEALRHYRYLAAFIENAVDAMEWYIEDGKISTQIKAVTESRLETMTYKAHMDRALETYRRLCEQDNNIRSYNIVIRKYVDPKGGQDGRGKPFTNATLADLFDCSEDTIKRDLSKAEARIKILFFGINGVPPEKGA